MIQFKIGGMKIKKHATMKGLLLMPFVDQYFRNVAKKRKKEKKICAHAYMYACIPTEPFYTFLFS